MSKTEFQKRLRREPRRINREDAFKLFRLYYPAMDEREAKKECQQQVNDLFFNRS